MGEGVTKGGGGGVTRGGKERGGRGEEEEWGGGEDKRQTEKGCGIGIGKLCPTFALLCYASIAGKSLPLCSVVCSHVRMHV